MHYIINTSHITPSHTAPILATVFLSHVSLVCCTSWERSPDRNVLDIELLFVNPAAAILLKNLYGQYSYTAMSLYSAIHIISRTPLPWQQTVSVGVIDPMQGE